MEKIIQIYSGIVYRLFFYIFLGAVIFVLLKYLFYWTRKFKRVSFLKSTMPLIMLTDYKPKALHLYFEDKEINDVIVTRIALWNSGTEIITGEDSKLYITTKNEKETGIIDCKKENIISGIAENIKKDIEEKYYVSLSGLREKEGIILQVVHTGDVDDLSLDFQIVGGEGTIEIDRNKHILSVNGKILLIREVWAKIMNKLGFKPEYYKTEIIINELLVSIIYAMLHYLAFGSPENILDRLFIVPTIEVCKALFFFALLDIWLLLIDVLLIQKIPEGLKDRL